MLFHVGENVGCGCVLFYCKEKEERIRVPSKKANVMYEGTRRKCVVKECVHGVFRMVEDCLSDVNGFIECDFGFVHVYTFQCL